MPGKPAWYMFVRLPLAKSAATIGVMCVFPQSFWSQNNGLQMQIPTIANNLCDKCGRQYPPGGG